MAPSSTQDRWPSGLRRTPGERVALTRGSRVRIPPCPWIPPVLHSQSCWRRLIYPPELGHSAPFTGSRGRAIPRRLSLCNELPTFALWAPLLPRLGRRTVDQQSTVVLSTRAPRPRGRSAKPRVSPRQPGCRKGAAGTPAHPLRVEGVVHAARLPCSHGACRRHTLRV